MVLVDNTVLSNFAKVNRLNLIKRAFDCVYEKLDNFAAR